MKRSKRDKQAPEKAPEHLKDNFLVKFAENMSQEDEQVADELAEMDRTHGEDEEATDAAQ